MLDFLLVMPSYRAPMPETMTSIEVFRIKSRLRYVEVIYARDALVARCRSIACSRFLKDNLAPYMVFLDDDIVFEPQHLEKLYQDLVDGYDIVAGLYPVRDGTALACAGYGNKLRIDKSIREEEYPATGFMGISRRALLQIRDKLQLPLLNENGWPECWPFFECTRGKTAENVPIYISEDWDFCTKARKAGLKTYLDTSIHLGHVGHKVWTVGDVVENEAIKQDDARKNALVSMLAEFLGEDEKVTIRHLNENPLKKIGEIYKESGLTLPEYYRKGNNWLLYDLLIFNSTDDYEKRKLAAAKGLSTGNVLDFGCGIGTASFFMAKTAKQVYGYDICQKMIDFCNFRKDRMGIANVEFHTTLPDDLSGFDLIMAVDVFEHLPDLHKTILELGKKVKSGTRLYHIDSFKHDIPVHIDHSDHIDQWLEEAGFTKYDTLRAIKK